MLRATAERPAYAAHYIQIGSLRARLVRLGYTDEGRLVIESLVEEVAHTLFFSGTLVLLAEGEASCVESSLAVEEVAPEILVESLSQSSRWRLILPTGREVVLPTLLA